METVEKPTIETIEKSIFETAKGWMCVQGGGDALLERETAECIIESVAEFVHLLHEVDPTPIVKAVCHYERTAASENEAGEAASVLSDLVSMIQAVANYRHYLNIISYAVKRRQEAIKA